MKIRALFFDVDGVLTDGRLYIDDRAREMKVFDTKDGHGIKMAIEAGLKVAWISGRVSGATVVRARDLGVRALKQGVRDKGAAVRDYLARWKIERAEAAACGDDLPDLPLFDACGFSACPADAPAEVRGRVDLVLERPGGHGAVREFVEEILRRNDAAGG
ncbi:MAG TPA: HAD hydrolase family protein [Thermoanaerobaculia bacterium]|nr:HAD hydrolase family protein [Thermoanaerobaculia bacterium]